MTKKSEGNHEHEHEFDGFTFEDIEKDFKFLADELTGKGVQNEVEDEEEEDYHEPLPERVFSGYNPTVTDFLARATTEKECEEIIAYCLKTNDITTEQADQLRSRLKEGGPRAFGTRKPGYYESMR